MPRSISTDAEFAQAVSAPTPTLVEFTGPNCVICRRLEPMLDTAALRGGHVVVVKVDASELTGVAEQHAIRSVPTLILFRDGKALDRRTGFVTAAELLRWFDDHAGAESAA